MKTIATGLRLVEGEIANDLGEPPERHLSRLVVERSEREAEERMAAPIEGALARGARRPGGIGARGRVAEVERGGRPARARDGAVPVETAAASARPDLPSPPALAQACI